LAAVEELEAYVATPHDRFMKIPASGTLTQRLRLATGLVLFAYLVTHLGNHALGLIDVETMQEARRWRLAVTRSWPGQAILIASALTHVALGVYKFLERRTLRISIPEIIQLAFGLLIPLMLMRHVLGMRGAKFFFDVDDNYYYALWVMWPAEGLWQAGLILLAWVHCWIGLFHWLRLKPWFLKTRPLFVGFAVLWPVLGYAGFVMAARVVQLETEFEYPFTDEQAAFLEQAMRIALYGYGAFLVFLVGVRLLRGGLERLLPRVTVAYAGGPELRVPKGYSLLEVSRLHDVPHASICGGRARCSTCRVRVLEGQEGQPEPHAAERQVLERIGAARNVRLACQLHVEADIKVATLLPARRSWFLESALYDKYYWGVEEQVTIMFCDLRGFTALSEKRLPFDTVFILNQYLSRMSEVIEDAGGYVDKFMGDGVLAIFGIGEPAEVGARNALAGVKAIGGVLQALNHSLGSDLPEPLDVAIGVDTGVVILGRVGTPEKDHGSRHITALGDTVNSASRLEGACREFGVQALISRRTLDAAGVRVDQSDFETISVKGKDVPLAVAKVARAMELKGLKEASA
jgi:adenylate cyclase